MKTPREVLFARHRRVQPKLDEVRHAALAQLQAPRSADAPVRADLGQSDSRRGTSAAQWPGRGGLVIRAALKLWQELVWPCRRTWAGLAVIWLLLLAANIEMKGPSVMALGDHSVPTAEVVRSFAEQQRLLAELLQPPASPPPAPPRPNPQPRSERPRATRIV
jgi:hypothetical protein